MAKKLENNKNRTGLIYDSKYRRRILADTVMAKMGLNGSYKGKSPTTIYNQMSVDEKYEARKLLAKLVSRRSKSKAPVQAGGTNLNKVDKSLKIAVKDTKAVDNNTKPSIFNKGQANTTVKIKSTKDSGVSSQVGIIKNNTNAIVLGDEATVADTKDYRQDSKVRIRFKANNSNALVKVKKPSAVDGQLVLKACISAYAKEKIKLKDKPLLNQYEYKNGYLKIQSHGDLVSTVKDYNVYNGLSVCNIVLKFSENLSSLDAYVLQLCQGSTWIEQMYNQPGKIIIGTGKNNIKIVDIKKYSCLLLKTLPELEIAIWRRWVYADSDVNRTKPLLNRIIITNENSDISKVPTLGIFMTYNEIILKYFNLLKDRQLPSEPKGTIYSPAAYSWRVRKSVKRRKDDYNGLTKFIWLSKYKKTGKLRSQRKLYMESILKSRFGWYAIKPLYRMKWFRKRFKRWFGKFREIQKNRLFIELLRGHIFQFTGFREKELMQLWFQFRRGTNKYWGPDNMVRKFSQSLVLMPTNISVILGLVPSLAAARVFSRSGGIIINGVSSAELNHFIRPKDMFQINPRVLGFVRRMFNYHKWLGVKLNVSNIPFFQVDWSMLLFTIVRWPYRHELVAPSFLSERWVRYYIKQFPVRITRYRSVKTIWKKYPGRR